MLTLTIARHAKSSWGDPMLRDFERPLNKRGKKQAQLMGSYLQNSGINPDLILCSKAIRARQTLKYFLANWQTGAKIIYEQSLYLASPKTITTLLEEHGDALRHIMIIGHNPGLHMLALKLSETGAKASLAALSDHYPTATISSLKLNIDKWAKLPESKGELAFFQTPKLLAAGPSKSE